MNMSSIIINNTKLLNLCNNLKTGGNPSLDDLDKIDPIVMTSAILMVISLLLPCFIWFLRNFMRIILKKNYELFNRSIKWILLFSLVLFIVSIILMVLATQGII